MQDASAVPAAAVAALLAPASPLSLARRHYREGSPAAAAAARVYDMLLGHPAAAVRSATTAAVLADMRHWTGAASAPAADPELQPPTPQPEDPSSADASEGAAAGTASDGASQVGDARGGSGAGAGGRKQKADAAGQLPPELTPAQVLHCHVCMQ